MAPGTALFRQSFSGRAGKAGRDKAMRKREVRIGQRYRSAEARWLEWEVVSIGEDGMNVPHAKIAAVAITEERTVACSVLADPRRFELIRSPEVAG